MHKLSKRLQAVADFVTWGSCAADVGTDHGFLPVFLVNSGKCPKVTAMDIRKGPLLRAQEHIAQAQLQKQISTRLSDGLKELSPGEADSIIIAGMGGLTMINILENKMEIVFSSKELVLGPQSDVAKVRMFLREHGMYIDNEDLVFEEGKFYPVLHVVMEKPVGDFCWRRRMERLQAELLEELSGDKERMLHIFDQYGEYPVCSRHPVLFRLLERDREREEGVLRALEKGKENILNKDSEKFRNNTEKMQARRKEVENRLLEISVLQKMINT